MNPALTKLIAQYLAGDLAPEDVKTFEDRMQSNEMLRNAVDEQRDIFAAAKRAHHRDNVQKIGKKYHIRKNFWRGGIGVLIAGLLVAGSLFVMNQFDDEIPELSDEVRELLNKQAPMELPNQYFLIPKDGGVVLSKQGILISVPEGAFIKNGKPYKDVVALQFQEVLTGSDILKSGLSTTSNGELLETGGMIGVTGYTMDGDPLDFNPEIGVYVQVPTKDNKPDMQLYDGERMADGSINWVNPEKLAKIPVPVSMNDLDFYPSGYEEELNRKKWQRSKASRDSLYLSFEEEDTGKTFYSGEQMFKMNCATCHHPTKDGTGPKLAGVRKLYRENGASDADVIQFTKNWQIAAQNNAFALSRTKLTPTAMTQFPNLTDVEIGRILDYVDEVANVSNEKETYPYVPQRKITEVERDYLYGDKRAIDENMSFNEYIQLIQWEEGPNYNALTGYIFEDAPSIVYAEDSTEPFYSFAASDSAVAAPCSYILPSNVLAFWQPKFNKTNLATREFEQRMQAIHETCNNAVLDIYTKNLDKTIAYCDLQVAAMGYDVFNSFAAENVGALEAGNPHVKQLQKFYESSVSTLKKRNAILQNQDKKRRRNHNAEIVKSRSKENKRTVNRESQAFSEEFEYNLDNVYQQLGKSRGFTITGASAGIATPSARSAVKNIDRLVATATVNQTTTTFTDEQTGKTAQLIYNDFTFEVNNAGQYAKLYAYVMPYELNSYKRITGKNGTFDHPLNNDIRYNIAVVGVKENGFGFFKQMNINAGNLGKIDLKEVSETKLNADVEQLNRNRNANPMPITEDLVWLRKEQKDYKEQRLREEMSDFRAAIRCIIFPCCGTSSGQGQSEIGESEDEGSLGI